MKNKVNTAFWRFVSTLPEEAQYQIRYFRAHQRFCNFRSPQKLSERIYCRMRYPAPGLGTTADKVAMRDIVRERIGDRYLVPALDIWDSATPAKFSSLPEQFVVKANHSAGQVKVVHEKSKENLSRLSDEVNSWLKIDYGKRHLERHYSQINPMLVVETALLDEHGRSPDDYKVHVLSDGPGNQPFCFVQVVKGRFNKLKHELYDCCWRPLDFARAGHEAAQAMASTPRPPGLDLMINLAKELALGYGYMRVDFFCHGDDIYLSEMTMTPKAGSIRFTPNKMDRILGAYFGWPDASVASDRYPGKV